MPAAHRNVGLGTIYWNFATREALRQAIIVQRTKALIPETVKLSDLASGRTPALYFA